MLNIPSSLRPQFEAYLQEKAIPKNNQALYQKWVCYYLDFCRKETSSGTPMILCVSHFVFGLLRRSQTYIFFWFQTNRAG